jgi:hypothetical protein
MMRYYLPITEESPQGWSHTVEYGKCAGGTKPSVIARQKLLDIFIQMKPTEDHTKTIKEMSEEDVIDMCRVISGYPQYTLVKP